MEEAKKFFRVAIFGSARIKRTDQIYVDTFDLACDIGRNGIDVVTGGGPGIMEAANSGHKCGSTGQVKSIGLLIKLPWENEGNKHLDIKKEFSRFSQRLDTFMELSNIAVIMPGGVGTALELFYTWQLVQVHHKKNTPIIMLGTMWDNLCHWIKTDMLKQNLISEEDLSFIYIVKNNEEALELINDFHAIYKKEGEDGKLESDKYKIMDLSDKNCMAL